MSNYLSRQAQIIADESRLRIYGLLLSFTHVLTFFYWNVRGFFTNSQSAANAEPICFPFFPECDLFRQSISLEAWQFVLYTYLFISFIGVYCFFNSRLSKLAYWLLFLLTFFKLGLHLSNYNFMGNYHYMVHIVSFAFLFLPYKFDLPKYLIVAFYLSAGFLKINIDWLSGAAMIRTPFIKGDFLSFSLLYVLFLELIFVFGLLSQNKWLRWGALLQFLIFHIFSWHIVGFYYPTVMFCLLGTFLIDDFFAFKNANTVPNRLLHIFSLKEKPITYAVLLGFAVLQIIPLLQSKDPSLTGVARLSSLNMFDSKTRCKSLMVVKTKGGSFHVRPPIKNLGTRLKCDPIRHLNLAHQLCRKNKKTGEIEKLSLYLFSRRSTQRQYQKTLSIEDVCALKNPLWGELAGGQE